MGSCGHKDRTGTWSAKNGSLPGGLTHTHTHIYRCTHWHTYIHTHIMKSIHTSTHTKVRKVHPALLISFRRILLLLSVTLLMNIGLLLVQRLFSFSPLLETRGWSSRRESSRLLLLAGWFVVAAEVLRQSLSSPAANTSSCFRLHSCLFSDHKMHLFSYPECTGKSPRW